MEVRGGRRDEEGKGVGRRAVGGWRESGGEGAGERERWDSENNRTT